MPFLGDRPDEAVDHALGLINTANFAVIQSLEQSGKLTGVLKTTGKLKEEDQVRKRDDFVKDTFSPSNTTGIGVLDSTIDFVPIDLKFNVLNTEQMDYFRKTVTSFYNIAVVMIDGTFTPEQYQAYFSTVIQPLAVQMEQEFTHKIFTGRQRELNNILVFDVKRMQMGSLTQKAQFYNVMLTNGVFSVNDVREQEQMPPIEGGDVHRVTLNSVSLADASDVQRSNSGADISTGVNDVPKEGDE